MRISSAILALSCAVVSETFGAESPTTSVSQATRINVLEMKSVPAGHFLVNLQVDGKERLLNLKVSGNAVECVTSDDARFKGLRGEFQLIGNGVFLVFFRNDNHRASQYWLFQSDGSAVVREVPDRGEKQRAIPVSDASIDVSDRSR
jgi:hypothetical protein